MALEVKVVSDRQQLWFGKAKYVGVQTCSGSIGILEDHQPLLATIVESTVQIHTPDGEKVDIKVGPGILSLDNNHINIVVSDISGK